MNTNTDVLEFKCPCCDAPLIFGGVSQQMKCEYCDNTFDLETLRAFSDSKAPEEPTEVQWENANTTEWNSSEEISMRTFLCDACGGELITDSHTAATFCPFCGNPTILPGRLSGGVKPDAIIPFKTTKEDAKEAFLNLCKGKPLLPKFFTQDQQLEKITGMYVPFWLYDCHADFDGSYHATRMRTWSDSNYNYTKTDHYLLTRRSDASYSGIPMDGSSKMEDVFMESIEPYNYKDMVDFEMAYLSGFLADKYDVESKAGENRIRQRVEASMDDLLQDSLCGFHTVVPASRRLRIGHSKARYVLLPVWVLNTQYRKKTYTFAMNGQTGKITGSLPICPKRAWGWFLGIWAAAATVVSLVLTVL